MKARSKTLSATEKIKWGYEGKGGKFGLVP
jgi:hypothetical protein